MRDFPLGSTVQACWHRDFGVTTAAFTGTMLAPTVFRESYQVRAQKMRILIATDGSTYSKRAVEECCRLLAHPAEAEIKVMSVVEHAHVLMAEPRATAAGFYQELDEVAKERAGEFVTEAADTLSKSLNVRGANVSSEVLEGTPAQRIIETAREWIADVIVVGSHGRGFWGRLLGSVSDAVVHHAPCSVLVVRDREA